MRAVILTAGCGGRLREVTGDLPKCLVCVGGMTLIDRQIAALRASGVAKIAVVTGHGAVDVMRACGPDVDFVHNPRFAATNSLYSLWLARDLLADGFVVLNCDVAFHQQVLVDLMTSQYDDALLVSPACNDAEYDEEEMKVRVRCGRVIDISKDMSPGEADGENMGVAKFGADGARLLIQEMHAVVASGALTAWLPEAFRRFAARRTLHAVDPRGFPWIEIDSPDDYRRACAQVAPVLDTHARSDRRRSIRYV